MKNLNAKFSFWKRIKCFATTLHRRNLTTKQLPVILDLCLRKTGSVKSRDDRDVIVVQKRRFQNVFQPTKNLGPSFSNFYGIKKRLWKSPFSWRISLDSTPNCKTKTTFSNLFSVVGSWCRGIENVAIHKGSLNLFLWKNHWPKNWHITSNIRSSVFLYWRSGEVNSRKPKFLVSP